MTFEQFKTQVDRLSAVYSAKYFPQERIDMLWREFCTKDIFQFSSTVDSIIADQLQPPTIKQIKIEFARHRERSFDEEKKRWLGARTLDGTSVGEVMSMLRKKMTGEVSTEEFASFIDVLRTAYPGGEPAGDHCNMCRNDGLVYAMQGGYRYAFRCHACESWRDSFTTKIPLWREEYAKSYVLEK